MLPEGSIRFRDVTKRYEIIQRATPRLGAWVLNKAFEHFRRTPFMALDGVSFDVEPGEMLGLVGPNGAGKSTVLKLIAGITVPTSGTVEVSGPVTSLLELGVGFHPELTGMENIFYNGALMGFPRERILSRLGDIIAFSGLEKFLYEPVKHFSSGMYSRLACSVALHLDPCIILVDEILAVGDAEFQQKGILKLLELHERGVTALLVTHETATARDICDRMIWIDEGRVREDGSPHDVHMAYSRAMVARMPETALPAADAGEAGTARVTSIRFTAAGRESDSVQTGEPARLEVDIEGTARAVRVFQRWRWEDGRLLAEELSPPVPLPGGRAKVAFEVERWPLLRAEVTLSVTLLTEDGHQTHDVRKDALRLRVESPGLPCSEVLAAPRARCTVSRS